MFTVGRNSDRFRNLEWGLELGLLLTADLGEIRFLDRAGSTFFEAVESYLEIYRHSNIDDYLLNPGAETIIGTKQEIGLLTAEAAPAAISELLKQNHYARELRNISEAFTTELEESIKERPTWIELGFERFPGRGEIAYCSILIFNSKQRSITAIEFTSSKLS